MSDEERMQKYLQVNKKLIEKLNGRFAYQYQGRGTPITSADMMPKPIEGIIPKTMSINPTILKLLPLLTQKLVQFAGIDVCIPDGIEEDEEKILTRGQLWYGDRVRVIRGQPNQCHANSCQLWEGNREEQEIAIATGYALSADGFWRQHTWLVHRTFRSVHVIETTVKRLAYFGFVMTDKEAEKFCYWNN